MSNALILNGTQPYAFAPGRLNAEFAARAERLAKQAGFETRMTTVAEGYDIDAEVAHHQWADLVIMQFPVNWMGAPWSFKRYMDEVYTAGGDGRLFASDGRTEEAPERNYGMGGLLVDTRYMISVTLNAPEQAFDNDSEPFFRGMSLDDLLQPVHLTARFLGMQTLPGFAAFDVVKNPSVEQDLQRFEQHLSASLKLVDAAAA